MKFLIRLFSILVSVAVLIGLDAYTKHMATLYLMGEASSTYLWGIIELIYAENPGGMLGFGDQLPEIVRFLVFEVMVGLVLIILFLFCLFKTNLGAVRVLSYILILSGGLGNLIDRLINDGKVVDFIVLGIGKLHTGIFNIADVYVSSGVILLLILSFVTRKTVEE